MNTTALNSTPAALSNTDSACLNDSAADSVKRQPSGIDGVGEVRLSDSEREAAIVTAGRLIEKYMAQRAKALFDWDVTGNFLDKADADSSRLKAEEAARLMAELIKGRSPEVVARMEAERGLA